MEQLLDMAEHPIKKKRKYSRYGCLECKRRKVKCDESKPICWQCSHLGKTCEYGKNEKRIEFREVKIPKDRESCAKSDTEKPPVNIESERESDAPALEGEPDLNSILMDATLLANDMLTSVIDPLLSEEVKSLNSLIDFTVDSPHYDKWSGISTALHMVGEGELSYLKLFYEKASYWLIPLADSPEENICNDILFHQIITTNTSENCSTSYLQSAMASLGAKYQFNITKEEAHNIVRKNFLRKAFKQLNQAFETFPRDSLIALKIESLILCVLLLTLDTSSFKSNEWKMHLGGAKDLFLKYQRMGFQDSDDEMRVKSLALARSWFSAIEAVAFVTQTGTLASDDEIEEMYCLGAYGRYSSVLKDMGLLTENGYNLFLGYSTEALSLLKETMKCVRKIPFVDEYNDKFLLISTLVQASRDYHYIPHEFGLVNIEDDTIFQDQPRSSYVVHQGNTYSIYDSIQQAHVDAVFLVFLLRGFQVSVNSPFIQNSSSRIWKVLSWMYQDKIDPHLVKKIMEKVEAGEISTFGDLKLNGIDLCSQCLIPPMKTNFRAMMFQTATILCGLTLRHDDVDQLQITRCKIIAYFQHLVEFLGAESGKASLELLFKRWRKMGTEIELKIDPVMDASHALPFS